ncbi:hypothetical protein CVT25_007336 [Psilocybe cyanescens]|uniref:Uncharacterized protein n=1 Tax=Psilocybe cyanescens TaxID=93625 RepID=A0A409XJF9_PSICY|nr:hypothetical protein CVT25_007336 [Psilocybe cyanescens]
MLRRMHTVLGPLQPRDVQPLLFAPTTPAVLRHLPGPLIRRIPPALGAAPRLAPAPAVPFRAPALSFNPLLSPPFPAAVVYGDHRERQSYSPNTSTPQDVEQVVENDKSESNIRCGRMPQRVLRRYKMVKKVELFRDIFVLDNAVLQNLLDMCANRTES